ncbi:MAG: type III-A CRISPR-associated RAMP protein Csm3 [Desulfobacteraceae bacterium]
MSSFLGKVMITGTITAITGLRVGGATGGLKIGGVDLNVITDPLGRPYIPGSSLKGKTRSLAEHYSGVSFDSAGKHLCTKNDTYQKCPVCQVWGTLGGKDLTVLCLTRLQARDAFLDPDSITKDIKDNIELEWTEVKFETAINRLKGTALDGSLRQVERIPAGARFGLELIYNVFDHQDVEHLKLLFIALEMLEQDYLGGMGSRGYGRVKLNDLAIYWNSRENYESGQIEPTSHRRLNGEFTNPSLVVQNFEQIKAKIIGD